MMNNTLKGHLQKCAFYWIGGASWIFKIDGVSFGCDPAFAPAGTDYHPGQRIIGPVLPLESPDAINYWLLTHNHVDHIDEEGIRYLSPSSSIIAHSSLRSRISGRFDRVTYLKWGEAAAFQHNGYRITVEAVPAFHGNSQKMIEKMGPVNGYLVTLRRVQQKFTFYITGDTVTDPRLYAAINNRSVDILIANLGNAYASHPGGPITLSMNMFEDMLLCIRPKIALPVHFQEFDWFEMDSSDIARLPTLPAVTVPQRGAWLALDSVQRN